MLKDEYTIDAIDEAEHEGKIQFYIVDDLNLAKNLVKLFKGVVYTQVDGEKDRMYSRGIHAVNRTGMYAVVMNTAKPPVCGHCGQPLNGVIEDLSTYFEWNPIEGKYEISKVHDADLRTDLCHACDAEVTDEFEIGVENYEQ